MELIAEALDGLDDDAIRRVIQWTAARYDGLLSVAGGLSTAVGRTAVASPRSLSSDLGTLYAAAAPTTESEKALVVSYWLQVTQGQDELESAVVNAELRNLGHGVANITQAFDKLMKARPALAIQTRKSGRSQQARKKYKLTAAGIARVQDMTSSGEGEAGR